MDYRFAFNISCWLQLNFMRNIYKKKKKGKNSRDRGVCDGREPSFEDMTIDIITVIESTKKIKIEMEIPPN